MSILQPAPAKRRGRYLAPTAALTAASVLLAISLFLPYWKLTLVTRAHPDELRLVAYLGHLDGALEPVLVAAGGRSDDPVLSLSELERSLAVAMATVICLLLIAATFVHNRWAALLTLPALCFPAIVMADTARWLRPIVNGLAAAAGAPAAPSSLSLFGRLAMDGIALEIRPASGLVLATAASITVLAGLWLHRRAYEPDASTRQTADQGGRVGRQRL
ncbi:MAG TPA: hypothetical protein VGV61_03995 [Thermoanaerobaculia bacterium]|jgi:hypothetical protein|nr:hypothetical protein [Thermoanaerobaculia bacterium]